MFRSAFIIGLALAALLSWERAQAAPARHQVGDDFSLPADDDSGFEADSADMFGFSEGTDTGSAGERELQGALDVRSGKRILHPQNDPPGKGAYRVIAPSIGVQYGLTDDFAVEANLFGDIRRIRHVPDMADVNRSQFDGASVQFKYRMLERTRANRLGIAVQIEPRFFRINDADGRRQDGFDGETRLLWDYRLVNGALWYSGNLAMETQAGRFKDTRQIERQSGISLSQALSARLGPASYAGVELRYARAYDGMGLRAFQSQALFVGPTILHRFTKNFFVSAAWQVQVWGHKKAEHGNALDLETFERHYARIKFGMNF